MRGRKRLFAFAAGIMLLALAACQTNIDWEEEEQAMISNNSFGMLDDYYTTYIDSLLDRQKGIEPLYIHVPLHGT